MRRGQTSVEYLGTYAWAFLGLIVTLGALSYFGVFDADTYVPEGCQSGSQIACEQYFLGTDHNNNAEIILRLKNNYPRTITITGISVDQEEFGENVESFTEQTVDPGKTFDLRLLSTQSTMTAGNKYPVDFDIHFTRSGGETEYTVSGSAMLQAQEDSFDAGLAGVEGYCGDGSVDEFTEECDPPGLDSDACGGYRCSSDCSCVGTCGDGIKEGPEECEVGYACLHSNEDCQMTDCLCINDGGLPDV